MTKTEDLLQKEIAILAEQLKRKKSALASIAQANALSKNPDMPFIGMRPSKAVAQLLEEAGLPVLQDELIQRAVDRGAAFGKKRARHNIRIAIEMGVDARNLKKVGELIGFPSWPDSVFETK